MGKNERQTYLKAIRTRYRRARKKVKVTILDEFCAGCGYHRKYAIRLLNQRGKPRRKRRAGTQACLCLREDWVGPIQVFESQNIFEIFVNS